MSALKSILSSRISGYDAKALAQADFKEELFRLLFNPDHIRTDFLDFCFNAILSDEPIGVKSLAIKLAYAQSAHYPELLEEIDATLQLMEPEELPAALKHLRGKMLAKETTNNKTE